MYRMFPIIAVKSCLLFNSSLGVFCYFAYILFSYVGCHIHVYNLCINNMILYREIVDKNIYFRHKIVYE